MLGRTGPDENYGPKQSSIKIGKKSKKIKIGKKNYLGHVWKTGFI
jgi:hypothetical protein